jgi:UDP-N-acetylglucosamine transferase subunit ALG13
MDNHQHELAEEMAATRCMAIANDPDDLVDTIRETDWGLIRPMAHSSEPILAFKEHVFQLLSR